MLKPRGDGDGPSWRPPGHGRSLVGPVIIALVGGMALLSGVRHPSGYLTNAPGTDRRAGYSTYKRPTTAPNGTPWPTGAAYIENYPYRNADGANRLEVRNDQGVADVFLKLLDLSDTPATPVRYVFIPAGGVAVIGQLRGGSYEIRYRNLATGAIVRTLRPIELLDDSESGRRHLVNHTVTLYGVPEGNMPTARVAESGF